MLRTLICSLVLILLAAPRARCDLIAYWNFNTYDGDAHTINADEGSGAISVEADWPSTNLFAFDGTTLNALSGVDAGDSLSLANQNNNGRHLDISFATNGLQDVVLSFASQRTETQTGIGFNSNQVSYSSDGGASFTNFGSAYDPPTSYDVFTFDFSSELDNISDAVIRITFDGATSSGGNNRIDNVQVNAAAIPEPSAFLFLALAAGASAVIVGRRRANGARENGHCTLRRVDHHI